MRKIALLIVLIFLLGCFGTRVLAQNTDLPLPGLTPDSSFYFLDTLGEKLGMFFTFSDEKKAEKALNYAEEKLAEAKSMAEKNKTKALERATQNYQGYLNIVNEKVEELSIKGKDIEKLVNLISEKTLRHQEILLEIYEKVSEQAREGVEKAIEVSKRGHEEAIEAVSKVKEKREKPAKEEGAEKEVEIDVSDWKAYRNEKHRYELKYPKDWTVREVKEKHPVEESLSVECIVFDSPNKNYFLAFGLKEKGDDIMLTGRTGVGGGDFVEGDTVKVGNTSVKTTNLVYEGKIKEVFYPRAAGIFEINGFEAYAEFSYSDTLGIDYDNLDMKNLPELNVANQILSTFEFIEVDEAANWKTYQNEKYRFEFRYPPQWYLHYPDDPKGKDESVLFLKSKEIPDIGATEWYALGDQMTVWISEMIGRGDKKLSKEEYIQENFPDEGGAVPIIDKKWVIINGIDMLRIEQESAGANLNNLQYLHFKDDKVYIIYLYPYEPDNSDFSQNCIDFEKLISTFRFIK